MTPYAPRRGGLVWHPEQSRGGRSDRKAQVRFAKRMKPLQKGRQRMQDKQSVRNDTGD